MTRTNIHAALIMDANPPTAIQDDPPTLATLLPHGLVSLRLLSPIPLKTMDVPVGVVLSPKASTPIARRSI